MAAVMGETYPDLYAAVGIHSGLPYGSANDVVSAFAAMRGETVPLSSAKLRSAPGQKFPVRTIVFHGSADHTVSPVNAGRIFNDASLAVATAKHERGQAPGGRAFSRSSVVGSNGAPAAEYWMIEGAGHAWSGGQPGGSYTEPEGPDASAEMVRFFLAS